MPGTDWVLNQCNLITYLLNIYSGRWGFSLRCFQWRAPWRVVTLHFRLGWGLGHTVGVRSCPQGNVWVPAARLPPSLGCRPFCGLQAGLPPEPHAFSSAAAAADGEKWVGWGYLQLIPQSLD